MLFDVRDVPKRDLLTVVVLDVETTGLPRVNNANPATIKAFDSCRMLSLAAIKWRISVRDGTTEFVGKMHHIVSPTDHTVPPCPVHDITHEVAVREGIALDRVLTELCSMTEGADLIVAYNATFDYSVIMSEMYRYSWKSQREHLDGVTWACAMRMATVHFGVRRWPKLGAAHALMFPGRTADPDKLHDALYDAAVASQVFLCMLDPALTNGDIVTGS